MPNLKEGSAVVWFKDIKFIENLTDKVEPQHSVELSTASYCASSVASLKLKSSIHNELAWGMDKSSIIFDYSYCHFTGLLCSDQRSSLKHPTPTVGCGPYARQLGRSASSARKMPTRGENKANSAHSTNSAFFKTTITDTNINRHTFHK